MNMPLVIACRHGDYDESSLSQTGITQSILLAEAIKGIIGNNSQVRILTSPEARAIETSKIIERQFSSGYQIMKSLACFLYDSGVEAAKEIIAKSEGSSVVIAVSHARGPRGIIAGYCLHYGMQKYQVYSVLQNGSGLVLAHDGTVSEIP